MDTPPSPSDRRMRFVLLALLLLTTMAFWKTSHGPQAQALFDHHPDRVMGTVCMMAVLAAPGDGARAQTAFQSGEQTMRDIEAHMSTYLEDSELSRLNKAPAQQDVPLSRETLYVLHAARSAADRTEGAFDTTCRPLLTLWKEAGLRKRLPSEAELTETLRTVGWRHFVLTDAGARKSLAPAQQDLGGLGKGYAVDRALETLRASGLPGGLAQIGGDTRVFGPGPGGGVWDVEIRHPFREGICATIALCEAAVCTSGNYQRYTEIDGHRYSHIVDPRTGHPVEIVPSVTVIAPDCISADIWATALSVLGPNGLEKLKDLEGFEALMIIGTPSRYEIRQTPGFARWLKSPVKLD